MKLKDWSYSRYSTWKKCPALLRFQTLAAEKPPMHPAAERGVRMHKNIEMFLLGESELIPELSYYHAFLTHLREQKAVPEVPIALDRNWQPVEWDSPERWVRLVLDAVLPYPTMPVIYDWKTGKEYPDHRDQREIYAISYHSILPAERSQVYHTYLDTRQNTTTVFSVTDIPGLRQKWEIRAGEMLADREFVPNPGFYCRTCHFSRGNGGPCRF